MTRLAQWSAYLHEHRARAGLTYRGLQRKVRINWVQLCRYEKGQHVPRAKIAERMRRFYRAPASEWWSLYRAARYEQVEQQIDEATK